jgi:enoyl-CoA hydratase/carnithine racemase
MLSFSHDLIYVVDKAVFACNEVDIGIPLPPGMNTVIKRKHTNSITFRDMTLFGKKFTEKEVLDNKMIDGIVQELKPVIEKAKSLTRYGSNRANFRNLKAENNKEVVDACFNKQFGMGTVGEFKVNFFPKL